MWWSVRLPAAGFRGARAVPGPGMVAGFVRRAVVASGKAVPRGWDCLAFVRRAAGFGVHERCRGWVCSSGCR